MLHYPGHLVVGAAAFVAALAISRFTQNRLIRRKLRLSLFLLGAYVLVHLVQAVRPDLLPQPDSEFYSFEELALAAALINLFVVTLINPLREDRVPDRFPSIVQDAFVIGILMLVATFAFGNELLATSAIGAVVVGFALQDTLGNAFAGLAIQSEKPFNIGHWVTVGEHEGRVAEVTWRATKLRTKTGNFVILPNSEVGKAAITNYSEPAAPMRLYIDVGVSYDAPPNRVKAVLTGAMINCPLVLRTPAPDAMIHDFGDSAIIYRMRFWIQDFELDEEAADQVRASIYYAFRRHGIEIPYPIQIEYSKELPAPDADSQIAEREQRLAGVDLFASLSDDQRRMIAASMSTLVFADGETIVRQGDPGDSMYVVGSGQAAVRLDSEAEPIAVIGAGEYFGEMSLLTGDPRSATVIARGDVVVFEVGAEVFRHIGDVSPQAVEQMGIAAATRRSQLENARASSQAATVVEAPSNFLARMRKFLHL